jgi:hypothetical protein
VTAGIALSTRAPGRTTAQPADPAASAPTAPATAATTAAAAPPVPTDRSRSGTTGTAERTRTHSAASEPTPVLATDTPFRAPAGEAEVAVTFAGWDAPSGSVEVDAYVGNVIEDGGTCTLTLSRPGARSQVVSGPAGADATTTICAPLHVAGGQLASGSWTATVTYSSATASGSADPAEVTVP